MGGLVHSTPTQQAILMCRYIEDPPCYLARANHLAWTLPALYFSPPLILRVGTLKTIVPVRDLLYSCCCNQKWREHA